MGCRVLRRHIWGYSVCLCPIKGTPGLNELKLQSQKKLKKTLMKKINIAVGRIINNKQNCFVCFRAWRLFSGLVTYGNSGANVTESS